MKIVYLIVLLISIGCGKAVTDELNYNIKDPNLDFYYDRDEGRGE